MRRPKLFLIINTVESGTHAYTLCYTHTRMPAWKLEMPIRKYAAYASFAPPLPVLKLEKVDGDDDCDSKSGRFVYKDNADDGWSAAAIVLKLRGS